MRIYGLTVEMSGGWGEATLSQGQNQDLENVILKQGRSHFISTFFWVA